jgi:stage II sporulation protein P
LQRRTLDVNRDEDRKRRFRYYTLNFSGQQARTTIVMMSLAVAVFAVIVGALSVQLLAGDSQKGLAGRILHSISGQSLGTMLSQEVPMYASLAPSAKTAEAGAYPKGIASMLFYVFTDIDTANPLTLLGYQIPGMAVADFKLLTPDPQYDVPPTDHDFGEIPPNLNPKPREKVEPIKSDKPLVYVYHSHNRESFLPEIGKTDPNMAYDGEKNIELSGKWILEELKKCGIPGMQTAEDYWQYPFQDAYDYSRKTVQKVLAEQKDLKLIFDIHRDAGERDVTTRKVNGEDYAAVYWIVGGGNPNHVKNAELATKLNEYMQKLYPGLSRGVWARPYNANFDTRYNQDLSPNMVLIEIGGPYNTLEEVQRTSVAIAKVTEAYLKDLQKLSTDVQVQEVSEQK